MQQQVRQVAPHRASRELMMLGTEALPLACKGEVGAGAGEGRTQHVHQRPGTLPVRALVSGPASACRPPKGFPPAPSDVCARPLQGLPVLVV